MEASAAAAALSDDPNQSPSPSTMAPQNYVQQLASALGLNSNVASTDFESLIELNRRQQQQQQQQMNLSNVSALPPPSAPFRPLNDAQKLKRQTISVLKFNRSLRGCEQHSFTPT